jgi:hypothetical protein
MYSAKSILFILAVCFSWSASAADPNNTTEQRDKTLERRHSGETMQMRDCLIKYSNDRALCEQELSNNPNKAITTETPRRLPNTNSEMKDDIKTKNTNPVDVQNPDIREIPSIEPLPPNNTNPRIIEPSATDGTSGNGTISNDTINNGTTGSGTTGNIDSPSSN